MSIGSGGSQKVYQLLTIIIMSHLTKKIRANSPAKRFDIYIDDVLFRSVPRDKITLPTEAYKIVMFSCGDIFEQMIGDEKIDMSFGQILDMMEGIMDKKDIDKWVKESEIMKQFTIKEVI